MCATCGFLRTFSADSSHFCPLSAYLRPHCREKQDFSQRLGAGEHHHQTVDSEADAAGRGHSLFERLDESLVIRLGLVVAAGDLGGLLLEPPALLVGVVQLGEGVGDLDPADEGLPTLDQAGLGAVGLGEGERARPGSRG